VFGNSALRIIFRSKSVLIGGWRILYKEEVHYMFSSPNIIKMKSRRMRRTGHVARMGRRGKPEGKR
jgi:hypothetical protein